MSLVPDAYDPCPSVLVGSPSLTDQCSPELLVARLPDAALLLVMVVLVVAALQEVLAHSVPNLIAHYDSVGLGFLLRHQ